jgi:hypothetical protein
LDHALTRSVPCAKSPGFPGYCISRSAPAMENRVASLLSSFGATGAGTAGRPTVSLSYSVSRRGCRSPRTPHPRALPAFDLLVALNFVSYRRFQRFSSSELPRNSISPVAPHDASRVSPHLHLPALPAIDHRVAPIFESFSASVASTSGCPAASLFQLRLLIQVPGCPGSCIFRLYRQRIFELPRISRSSVPPVLELLVSLELRSPGCSSRCRL